jgi:hypothetical protein
MAFERVREAWHNIEAWRDELDDSPDAELEEMVAAVYGRLVEWFGPPTDAACPVHIMRGPHRALMRHRFKREYTVIVAASLSGKEKNQADVATTVCLRVLAGPRGLVREPWVTVMLCVRAAQHILREHGMSPYAGAYTRHWSRGPCALSGRALRAAGASRNTGQDPY